ncbi:MAG: aldolase/citrate lyase family protein [Thermomicrobium sp.]|nr:aldolase/citrate lyase family protein [Thermomicrobium sp.]
MRENRAKQKMRAGQPAFGYTLQLGAPLVAEALANCGIDFILIDTQHGTFGSDTVIETLMALSYGHAVPMARVARNDYTMIGRLLDDGALGIVVPLVHTPEEARAVADACRFPPRGRRSWGWGRARVYGADYPAWIDEELFVAVQIESAQAVENAEAILSVPGIDGCWIGPGDLALSLGLDPHRAADDERQERAIERVLEACRNTGKIAGYAAYGIEDALRRAAQGFRFVTAGSDIGFLVQGALSGVERLGLEPRVAGGYGA